MYNSNESLIDDTRTLIDDEEVTFTVVTNENTSEVYFMTTKVYANSLTADLFSKGIILP
jgi:hypothetical protein